MSESSGASLAKRPHFVSRIETCPGGKMSVGCNVSASSADARKKGAVDVSAPDVSWSTASSSSSSLVFQADMLSSFFDQWRSISSKGLCLIWFRFTIFSFDQALPYSVISGSSM